MPSIILILIIQKPNNLYRIVGKFGGGKVWRILANRPLFAKLKPSKSVLTINNLLADPLIHQTFFHQRLE